MARVDEAEVRKIVDTNEDTDSVAVAIEEANNVVTDALGDEGLSTTTLTLIERRVAAHFLAGQDPTVESERLGDESRSYEGLVGEGFKETRHGRRALALDPTGKLQNYALPEVEFFTWGVSDP